MNSARHENKMHTVGNENKTASVVEIIGKTILLRDDATGTSITANRAVFRHDESIAVGDRFSVELVSQTQTANRVRKVEDARS